MTRRRITDQLVATLAGCLIGVLLMAALTPTDAWTVIDPAPRSSPQAELGSGRPSMTTEGVSRPAAAGLAARTGRPDALTVAAIGTRPAPPTVAPDLATLRGIASFVDPSYGPRYLALPLPGGRGQVVTICREGRCVTRRSTDTGPERWTGRVADLSFADFAYLCDCNPWTVGLTRVTVRYGASIPAPPDTSTGEQP